MSTRRGEIKARGRGGEKIETEEANREKRERPRFTGRDSVR